MLLVMVRDLLFASKIDSAAKRAGVEIAWVPRGTPLVEAARERAADVVLVDLGEPGAVEAIRDLLSERPQVRAIGFAGHLRTDLIDEARAIGVAEVLTRGQLNAGLVDVLTRAAGAGAAPG
jgi:DNA-binding NarL/FixJ family response regulator